jgi:thiol-disulfide isomerase/thioredoxin
MSRYGGRFHAHTAGMRRLGTTSIVLLILFAVASPRAQDTKTDYDGEMRNGETYFHKQQYQQALRAYQHAYALTGKSSYDALVGIALAYRGLGAFKDVLDLCKDGLKLAGGDKARQAQIHNLRGAALSALAEKPDDKKLKEAEAEFRAALEANASLAAARVNLGTVLLKMHRDDEGLRELKDFVDHAPDGPAAENARRLIEDPRRAREAFAPEFSFRTRNGESISLASLKGKTVLLDFWGSWCGPCVQATPALIKLRRKLVDQPVVFVGIAKDEEPKWTKYLEKASMDWPQYLDADERVSRMFKIEGFPTYIVLDGDGIVRARRIGYASDTTAWLEREIKKTLKNLQ